MKLRFPVRFLVVDRGPAEAAGLVASLRRSGYEVKPKLVQDLSAAAAAISDLDWDVILVGHQLQDCPVTDVIDLLRQHDRDAPVIVIDEPGLQDHAARDRLLEAGVCDIVPRNEARMLEHTVRRELAALDNRRLVRNMQRHYQDEELTLQWLVARSSDRLAITSGDDIITANTAFLELFGLADVELPWRNGLLECVASHERGELQAFLGAGGADRGRPVQIELQGAHTQLGGFPLLLDVAPAAFQGRTGRRIVATSMGEEHSAAIERQSPAGTGTADTQQVAAAQHDRSAPALKIVSGGREQQAELRPDKVVNMETSRLTERKRFLSMIDDACRTISGRRDRVGIIYVDLDDFPGLKQLVGITGIEKVMQKFLAKLQDLCPADAIISRISDDDFGVLIRAADWDDIIAAFRRIEQGISGVIFEVDERSVMVSVGVGLTGLLEDDSSPETVLERAFNASLSEINSITGVREEAPEEDDTESVMQELITDLSEGMQDGRLFLVYQPVVRLRGTPIELYEVFMRFRDRQGEMVHPRKFLDAAEAAGFAADLNLWLVEKVIDVLGEQHRKGRPTRLMVKVTDQAVKDVRIPLAARNGIRKHHFSPEQLIFEVCEMTSVNQVKATRTMMHAMRGLHCGTAIEHFGITRKPFRLLEHVSADYLTLAASVVNGIADDDAAVQRVRHMSSRARKLGKTTCAEYVDDAASVGILYDAGVDFMQGYYIQPPAPHLDFEFSMMVG